MDTHTDPRTHDSTAGKSTGCCGGKSAAKPQDAVEPRADDAVETKPAKSGCCCGQN